ncbi:MAG: hypothetical protein ACRDD7_14665 [Peptostreptococcaceae bacterium]
MIKQNDIPGIKSSDEFFNPTLNSPNSPFVLPFYQTKETLMDVEQYKSFLQSAIRAFRHSRTYTHYKGYLIGIGLDRCQFHPNIRITEDGEIAKLEMHHNMLTIFDITIIICEHELNTKGYISSFDLIRLLKEEHTNNRVQLLMLSLTPHQLYHNNQEFFIHPDMCFGNWYEFLEKYHRGITRDLAFKILFYLKRANEEGGSNDNDLLKVRDKILDWSRYNE